MRKIITADVFKALRLIQKSGLRDKLTEVIKEIAAGEMEVEKAGITGMLAVLEVFSEEKCEHLIYEWLAGPAEKEAEEIAQLELSDLAALLKRLSEENDVRYFFTVLSDFLSKKR